MILPRGKRLWLYLGVAAVVVIAVGGFVSFGPPKLFAKSETPEFCAGCHVMESQYEAWRHQGSHRRIKCIDCHLPNDNFPNHAAWKGLTGMWDTFAFYSGRVPENIQISKRGAQIAQANCRRCHEETLARVTLDRNCWECHRRLTHKLTGAMETLSP